MSQLVALTLGQSNGGNYGPARTTGGPGAFVVTETGLAPAADPLPGADGDGGSVWTRFARRLLEAGLYCEIVLAPASLGGTTVADWAPGGRCQARIDRALDLLRRAGLAPTRIFWHQGERDTLMRTSQQDYARDLQALIASLRRRGLTAPIHVCVATYRLGADNPAVRAAQREAVDAAAGILPGPDTDTLGRAFRYDDCHLNEAGQARFAEMLVAETAAADRAAVSPGAPAPPAR